MSGAANDLTPAEAERLAILAEECGEVIQAVCKVLRFGYQGRYDDGESNREALQREMGDLHASVSLMMLAMDLDAVAVAMAMRRKREKLKLNTHHQSGVL